MKNMQRFNATLLAIVIAFCSMLSFGAETKRAWMPSACYKFNLDVMDKFDGPAWNAKYVITSSKGRVFIAERIGASDSNSSAVVFPDDFRDAKVPGVSASVDCFYGEKYTWQIYVDGELRDSGTIGFTRNNPRY